MHGKIIRISIRKIARFFLGKFCCLLRKCIQKWMTVLLRVSHRQSCTQGFRIIGREEPIRELTGRLCGKIFFS